MKKNTLLWFLFVTLVSCEADQFSEIPNSESNDKGVILVRSAGDGKNDLLGFGYNCLYSIGDNFRGAKNQIIDVNRYINNDAIDPVTGATRPGLPLGKVETAILHGSSTQYETYGSCLSEFYQKISESISMNTGKLFTWGQASFKVEYDKSIDSKESYSFYKADLCRNTKRMYFDTYSPKRLKYYLTDGFRFALEEYSAKEIVDDYGTHVLTDIYVGGKLSILVSAIQKSTATTDVKKFTSDVCNMLTSGSKDSVRTYNSFTDLSFTLVQYGGKNVETIKKEISEDGAIGYDIFNWSEWVNGVDESNSNLIYSEPATLIPITEFIADPVLKQEVEDEITRRGAVKVETDFPIIVDNFQKGGYNLNREKVRKGERFEITFEAKCDIAGYGMTCTTNRMANVENCTIVSKNATQIQNGGTSSNPPVIRSTYTLECTSDASPILHFNLVTVNLTYGFYPEDVL